MQKIRIACMMIVLSGCASSSGVLKSARDTFTVNTRASPGAGGGPSAKRSAYSDASQECAKTGKTVDIVAESASAPSWTDGMHSVDLIFKCV